MAETVRLIEYRFGPELRLASAADNPNDRPILARSGLSVGEFVETRFLPGHILTKGLPGRRHYQAILKHILNPERVNKMFCVSTDRSKTMLKSTPGWPYVDDLELGSICSEDIRRIMSAALQSGYSTQTVKHIRSALSAIISFATKEGCFSGANPAMQVSLPQMQRKTPHILTFSQTVDVLQAMRYPEWEITTLVILTGMTIAEICGLQWKFVNLSNYAIQREGEAIPPVSIAVRKQWYRGELSDVPRGRKKDLLIPGIFKPILIQTSQAKSPGWNDFVLVTKSGKPINQINLAARRLKVIGKQLDLPWLSWQVFRRTRAHLLAECGAQLQYELATAITSKRGFRSGSERPIPVR